MMYKTCLSLALLSLTATTLQAAPVLTLSVKWVSRRAVGSTTPLETINSSQYYPTNFGTFDYQIEVDAQISSLDPGNSFGSLAFDINVNGQPASATGPSAIHPTASIYAWKPNNPTWTDDAADPPSPVFAIVGDEGSSPTDLAGILAVAQRDPTQDASGIFGGDSNDPRLSLLTSAGPTGFAAPFNLGTFVLTWDGSTAFLNIGVNNVQFTELDDTTHLYGPTITPQNSPGSVIVVPAFAIIPVPEPASLGILAFGAAALFMRPRRA